MLIECEGEQISKHPLFDEAAKAGHCAVGTLKGTTGVQWYCQVGLNGNQLMLVFCHDKREGHAFVYEEHRDNFTVNCPPGIDSNSTSHALGCIFAMLLLAGEWQRHHFKHVALPSPEEIN